MSGQWIEKIRELGIREYGINNENLSDKIIRLKKDFCEIDKPFTVVGALDNEDNEKMLLSIVRENPNRIINGIRILGEVFETESLVIYLPEEETQLGNVLKDESQKQGIDVEIFFGIVDVRIVRGGCISHFETLAHLSDIASGNYNPTTRLSIKIKTSDEISYSSPLDINFGTSVKEIKEIKNENIKAIQIGNKLFGADALELEITDGVNTGCGVITIFYDDLCMINEAHNAVQERKNQSCGKCTFCREGLNQLQVRLNEIINGKGEMVGLDVMEEIGEAMRFSSLCSIGTTGADFALETLNQFQEEYQNHIKKRKCSSKYCKAFINIYIDPNKCIGCHACVSECSENCIAGLPGYIHMVEDVDCTKCKICIPVCKNGAIIQTESNVPKVPDKLTKVGRFKNY